jgi:hypothetical protein
MLPNLTLFIVTLIGMALTILIMFLPTIIELRKPRDAGPRLIKESFTSAQSLNLKKSSDVEDKLKKTVS